MAIDTADIEALSEGDLKALIEAEWTRAKELDDKQQKLTAALSVAVTIGGLVGSTMLQDLNGSWAKYAAAALFLAAAALLATGAAIGFNGLRPKKRYGYGASYMRIVAAGGDAARAEMVGAAREFQRDNTIRSNEAIAATISIRNGVLVFALASALSLVATATGKPEARPDVTFAKSVRARGRIRLGGQTSPVATSPCAAQPGAAGRPRGPVAGTAARP